MTDTALGEVRGAEGTYHYRGHPAVELARHEPLEAVWRLLVDGALPDADERDRFAREVAALRALPPRASASLAEVAAAGGEPLAALRSGLSAVAAELALAPTHDLDAERRRADALRVAAVVPTLVAALHRHRAGQAPVPPRDDLGHAANYLWMLTGREPDPAAARALEQYLVLTLDHGLNASTFTARVVTSTGADLGAAVVAALGALSGPLHGGAPSRALEALDAIGDPARAEAWVREQVRRGRRIMGFGHRVYTTVDPRARLLREVAQVLDPPLAERAAQVEQVVVGVLAELKPGRNLYANVEYYAGVVLEACGVPRGLFTSTFAVSRAIGWSAHVLEQAADNRLFRPTARYVGPTASPSRASSSRPTSVSPP